VSAAPASGPPIEIPAILSTTGVSAFFGGGEARALGVVESMVNEEGGVKGRPIHFNILDVTNAEVTVQLLSGLIAKKTAFFLGPTFPGACFAVLPLIDKNGPVGMCLNPAGHPKPGSDQFALYADSFDVDRAFLRYFRENGLTRLALVNANDGSGRDADAGFNWAFSLPENRTLTKVAEEHYNPGDVSVAAQMARVGSNSEIERRRRRLPR
jgi:branched-chain amino acid transport system substrate-binding protein